MGTKKARNGEIELLRFIFAIIIVLHHSKNLFDKPVIFEKGSLAVEFFLITSGYLMMASIDRRKDIACPDIGKDTRDFIFRKIKGIYPEFIAAYVMALVFALCTSTVGISEFIKGVMTSIPGEMLFLSMTGIGEKVFLLPVWYISSMLLSMLILYPIIRKWKSSVCSVVIPLISFLLLGYLLQVYKSILTPSEWIGFTFKGNLRAIAEIGIGTMCYSAAQYIKTIQTNKLTNTALTLIKWGCFLFTVICTIKCKGKYQPLLIIAFSLLIILAFSEKCIETGLYNNKFVFLLGQFSMPLYFAHGMFTSTAKERHLANLNNILPESLGDWQRIGIYFVCSVIAALIVMYAGKLIRKIKLFAK